MDQAGLDQLISRLRCLETDEEFEVVFPWFRCAEPPDRSRFRSELELLLCEAEVDRGPHGFEFDLDELGDLAAEYAGRCGHSSGAAILIPEPSTPGDIPAPDPILRPPAGAGGYCGLVGVLRRCQRLARVSGVGGIN